jgi:hypothetical protein
MVTMSRKQDRGAGAPLWQIESRLQTVKQTRQSAVRLLAANGIPQEDCEDVPDE